MEIKRETYDTASGLHPSVLMHQTALIEAGDLSTILRWAHREGQIGQVWRDLQIARPDLRAAMQTVTIKE